MLLKSLYRYVLGDWNQLTEEEIKAIPAVFSQFQNSEAFAGILKCLTDTPLRQILFGEKFKNNYFHFSTFNDEFIKECMLRQNARYHYFTEPFTSEQFNAFKTYYLLVHIIEEVTKKNRYSYSSDTFLNAYQLLVFYGEEDLEKGLAHLDEYCKSNNLEWSEGFMNKALDFNLRESEKNQTINLSVWRQLLQGKSRVEALKYFYIAPEIEAIRGNAPFDISQAAKPAKGILFVRRTECLGFASLCEESFIPEELYNQCLESDEEKRVKAWFTILPHLTKEQRAQFILCVPNVGQSLDDLSSLFRLLKPEEELSFVQRFQTELKGGITTLQLFKTQFLKLTTYPAQKQLVAIITPDVVRMMIKDLFDIKYSFKDIHVDYRYEFLVTVIGKERLMEWVQSDYNYKEFLEFCLPPLNQITFLKELFSVEKIRQFVNSSYNLEEQLKLIEQDLRYTYLKEFVGHEKLVKMVYDDVVLVKFLKQLNQADRLKCMQELFGMEFVRKMIPLHTYQLSERLIREILAPADQTLFLEQLPSEKEKFVLEAKKKIISTNFSTALMGMSGYSITLDDGTQKTVPKTVFKHWECILSAQKHKVTYEQAYESMKGWVEKANEKTGAFTYFSRGSEATDYYDWFKAYGINKTCKSYSLEC